MTFTGQTTFGRKCSLLIPRNADLVAGIELQVDLPPLAHSTGMVSWVRKLGHAAIVDMTLTIGASQIDKQYGEWLEIYSQFAMRADKRLAYNNLIGDVNALTTPASAIPAYSLYIPMRFFFNRLPGLALPLVALQFHNVQIDITFQNVASLIVCSDGAVYPTSGIPVMAGCQAWADFVYLDQAERQSFVNEQSEILIDQLQFTGAESYSNTQVKSRLTFNHPVKALFFALRLTTNEAANQYMNFTNAANFTGGQTITKANLMLNGTDRYQARDATYHNITQVNAFLHNS